jgi:hypothetical protein
MHSLHDLKKVLTDAGKKIKSYDGASLVVGKDTYSMLSDEYYLNSVMITRKELLSKIKKK